MKERLVDVLDSRGSIVHTYPVTLEEPAATDSDYEKKALDAARHGQLVPDSELEGLTARMHVSRGGQMQPFGDAVASDSETKAGLEEEVRKRAYFLWEVDGRPEGQTQEYWDRALEQHLRERAYVLWQQEGSRDGEAEANWLNLEKFQAH
jgi:hypothetical protein